MEMGGIFFKNLELSLIQLSLINIFKEVDLVWLIF